MKKYTKPMIAFESFSLCTNIAACDNEVTFTDTSCGSFNATVGDLEFVVFMDYSTGCEYVPTQTLGANDSVCYHVPGFALNLQGS